ncbi:Hypothetical protein CINCED_3A008827 [Cinara cedri]|uniref:Gustatory receptor n=1 Tax=Cinara cedri TaxID=506608 RepID=A0A5E4MW39_9HEMI|nr:Hypothetical protein CINCED_3A008827 [Cinara cedri]
MNDHVAFLTAVIAVQLYSAFDEIRSLLVDEELAVHLQTLSANAIGVISTLLTAVYSARLRRIRCTLDRVERSLQQTVAVDGGNDNDGAVSWPFGYRARASLALAIVTFGYLKYGQLAASSGVDASAYVTVAVTLLRTVSMAGHYYVTVMFVGHVYLVKRSGHFLQTAFKGGQLHCTASVVFTITF